jgi:HKD family nuclease
VRYLDSKGILSEIISLLDRSQEFDVAVAYSTGELPRKLIKALDSFLRRGGSFKFLVGIQRNTSGGSLQQLYDLPRSGLDLRCTKRGNFHPKMYLFRSKKGKLTGIVGSSNFSAAGFKTNIEANVLTDEIPVVNQIDSELDKLFNDPKVGAIDQGVIDELSALKPTDDKKRKHAIRRIKLSRIGKPRIYFVNMKSDEVNPYLKKGIYYSSRGGFTKCNAESVRQGDIVILRTIRPSPGVVGISTVKSIENIGKRKERDVRDPSSYLWRRTYVLHYEPIKKPVFQKDGPFNRKGWGVMNRFGVFARALRGTVVGADPRIAGRYMRSYKKARGAISVDPATFSLVAY